jgi:peptide/nickel transport system substrate-binding protein
VNALKEAVHLPTSRHPREGRDPGLKWALPVAGVTMMAVTLSTVPAAAESPKPGGTLTHLIAADAPPSFDAHREGTFATVYSGAPFYSVLIRVDPNNPSSTTDFLCDLCAEMPAPSDDGETCTFRIRDDVKWHDGSPLSADYVAAS